MARDRPDGGAKEEEKIDIDGDGGALIFHEDCEKTARKYFWKCDSLRISIF
jgi:hypothetical protein